MYVTFVPYRGFEAGDIVVARPGIEPGPLAPLEMSFHGFFEILP